MASPFVPLPGQKSLMEAIFDPPRTVTGLMGGLLSGKTEALLRGLERMDFDRVGEDNLSFAGTKALLYAPTSRQSEMVHRDRLRPILEPVGWKWNQLRFRFEYKPRGPGLENQGEIWLCNQATDIWTLMMQRYRVVMIDDADKLVNEQLFQLLADRREPVGKLLWTISAQTQMESPEHWAVQRFERLDKTGRNYLQAHYGDPVMAGGHRDAMRRTYGRLLDEAPQAFEKTPEPTENEHLNHAFELASGEKLVIHAILKRPLSEERREELLHGQWNQTERERLEHLQELGYLNGQYVPPLGEPAVAGGKTARGKAYLGTPLGSIAKPEMVQKQPEFIPTLSTDKPAAEQTASESGNDEEGG